MTNTIIVSHTVGITVSAGNTAMLNATLWRANDTKWDGAGPIYHANDHSGDPAFAADGYHLALGSAAIDKGVRSDVKIDIDGDGRPAGDDPDLGAGELVVKHIHLPLVMRTPHRTQ